MTDQQTGGTTVPAQDGGDAASAVTGTPDATTVGADAGGETPEQRVQRLEAELQRANERDSKRTAELNNYAELKQRLADIEAAAALNSPTAPGAEQTAQALQEWYYGLQADAAQGDRNAMGTLAMLRLIEQQSVNTHQRMALMEVPQDRRQQVQEVVNKARQRGESITPQTAAMILDAQALTQQKADIERREQALRAAEEAKARGVVGVRNVPAAPNVQGMPETMTFKDYGALLANAKTDAERDAIIRNKPRLVRA